MPGRRLAAPPACQEWTCMTRTIWFSACAAGTLCLAAAVSPVMAADAVAPAASTTADVASPHYGTWGYDASGEDPRTPPGVDFFRYANGAWYDREQIPSDRT